MQFKLKLLDIFIIVRNLVHNQFSIKIKIKMVLCALEQFLFQQAECNPNFDLYKIVFCFQIYKDIPLCEHTRLEPKKFSMQGWFS